MFSASICKLCVPLATLFALVGAGVHAQPYGVNLVVNGDAESNAIPDNKKGDAADWFAPAGWTVNSGHPIAVTPKNSYWVTDNVYGPGITSNFFVAGRQWQSGDNVRVSMSQTIDLSVFAQHIDAGIVEASLTARAGTWQFQGDVPRIFARFYNASGTLLGEMATVEGSALLALVHSFNDPDGNGVVNYDLNLGQLPTVTVLVPVGTRSVVVEAVGEKRNGSDNDAYFDDITFTLQPVPEPSTLAVLALGIGGLALRRRRS